MKTKVYTFYTDTHEALFKRFVETFERSGMADSFELVSKKFEQESSGRFMEEGWNKTMRKKVEYVLESIKETFGEWFIHADCDIQFFANMMDDMRPRIENYDLVAQSDSGTICAGFFACKSTERMRAVFTEVLNTMDRAGNDQHALNALKSKFSHQLLPASYFTIGNVNGGNVWNGEINFMPPKKVFMHHANYVIGAERKLRLMDLVESKVRSRWNAANGEMPLLWSPYCQPFPYEPPDKRHLGSDYGGWTIDINAIHDGNTVLDLGLGEDISFSQELATLRKVNIIGIDPTEKSHRYVESLPDLPLKLVKKAIAKDGLTSITMRKNKNPTHVSESFVAGHNSVGDDSYDVDCISITQLRNQYPNISLIKMDIEGGEYDVLDECIGIKQLCVEFHHFCIDGITSSDTNRCIKKLLDNGYEILDKNQQATEFTFRLKDR